jgi:uncharacterized protein YqjF (DUF2071 family)
MRRPFLTARSEYLVMLNYEVSPAALTPLVLRGTELDLWEGQALVSLVGFTSRTPACAACRFPVTEISKR